MRYLTAGESHGPRLTAIIEGIPAWTSLDSRGHPMRTLNAVRVATVVVAV